MTNEQLYDGRYRPVGAIGGGGMALVYRAFDTRLERTVAIKILREQFASEAQVVERFRLEGRVAAGLAHPNIVSVYDFGEEHGSPYMVMEYVPGETLRQVLAREAPMPLDRVIGIMRQLTAALDFAHAHGVVHRDIKPENILVTEKGQVKVGDFGIARALAGSSLTTTGMVLCTVAYASPEQVSSQTVTAESDLYSAGIVLYEMLTGHVPFAGETNVAVAMAQVQEPPVPPTKYVPSLPPAVEAVVLKALAKQPAERYHSGYDLFTSFSAAAKAARVPGTIARSAAGMDRRPAPAGDAQAAAARTLVAAQPMATKTVIAPRSMAQPSPRSRRRGRSPIAILLGTLAVLAVAVLVYRGQFDGNSKPPAPGSRTTPGAAATAQAQTPVMGVAASSHGASIALVTATGVGPQYAPIGVTSSFTVGGGDVYAVATIHGKAVGDVVRFTWRYPDGTDFVYDNNYVAPYGGTVTAYAQLTPRQAGAYTVTTSINGQVLATASFTASTS